MTLRISSARARSNVNTWQSPQVFLRLFFKSSSARAADPGPRGADDIDNVAVLGFPAERLVGVRGIRNQFGWVSLPSRTVTNGDFLARDLFCCGNDFFYGYAFPCAEIALNGLILSQNMLQCEAYLLFMVLCDQIFEMLRM